MPAPGAEQVADVRSRSLARVAARWLLIGCWAVLILALGGTTIFPDNHQVPRLLLRKAAHLGLYAVLALMLYHALGAGGPLAGARSEAAARRAGRARLLLALVLTALVAGLDEWHQAFVPGRSARLYDVALDTLGGALALLARRLGSGLALRH